MKMLLLFLKSELTLQEDDKSELTSSAKNKWIRTGVFWDTFSTNIILFSCALVSICDMTSTANE